MIFTDTSEENAAQHRAQIHTMWKIIDKTARVHKNPLVDRLRFQRLFFDPLHKANQGKSLTEGDRAVLTPGSIFSYFCSLRRFFKWSINNEIYVGFDDMINQFYSDGKYVKQ